MTFSAAARSKKGHKYKGAAFQDIRCYLKWKNINITEKYNNKDSLFFKFDAKPLAAI